MDMNEQMAMMNKKAQAETGGVYYDTRPTQQTGQGIAGVGTYYDQRAGQMAQTAPPIDTVCNIVGLLVQQAQELRERSAKIASQIAGSIPAPPSAQTPQPSQPSLIDVLRAISNTLGESLQEVERAQRSLAL